MKLIVDAELKYLDAEDVGNIIKILGDDIDEVIIKTNPKD